MGQQEVLTVHAFSVLSCGVRRWENERFKSDFGSTMQSNIHGFFFRSEYIKHR